MARLSDYDNSEQAVFVLLGDAGRALTGKHASELVSNYFEVTNNQSINLHELNSHCYDECQANANEGVAQEERESATKRRERRPTLDIRKFSFSTI